MKETSVDRPNYCVIIQKKRVNIFLTATTTNLLMVFKRIFSIMFFHSKDAHLYNFYNVTSQSNHIYFISVDL